MKTIAPFYIALAFLGMLLQGCRADRIAVDIPQVDLISFEADDIIDDGLDTRTSLTSDGKFLWSVNDTVGIYPNTGSQVYFSFASGEECKTASFDGGGWDFKEASTYYSYYPFIGDIYLDRTRIPVSFLGQEQNGISNFDHFRKYDFMYADAAKAINNRISFQYHHLICILRLVATLPAGTFTNLRVKAPQPIFVAKGYFDLTSESPAIVPTESTDVLSLALNNVQVSGNSTCEMYIISAPFNLSNQDVVFTLTDVNGDEIQCVFTIGTEFVTGKRYRFTCTSWSAVPHSGTMPIDDWTGGVDITIP